jgi:hypothetical protein
MNARLVQMPRTAAALALVCLLAPPALADPAREVSEEARQGLRVWVDEIRDVGRRGRRPEPSRLACGETVVTGPAGRGGVPR